MPFIGVADRDPIVGKSPELLDQPVIEFPCPLSAEKRHDLGAPADEFGAVPPMAVWRIGQRHLLGITTVPSVFCQAHFFRCAFDREWGRNDRHLRFSYADRTGIAKRPSRLPRISAEARLRSRRASTGASSNQLWVARRYCSIRKSAGNMGSQGRACSWEALNALALPKVAGTFAVFNSIV